MTSDLCAGQPHTQAPLQDLKIPKFQHVGSTNRCYYEQAVILVGQDKIEACGPIVRL